MTAILERIKNTPRIDYINYLILLYAFTLSFPGEIKRVIIFLMIIFWLTDTKKYNFIIPSNIKKLFITFTIFIIYGLISFLWTESSIQDCIDYISKYWYLFPIFIIFKYLKKENISIILSFFLMGIFISEIFSYGNYFEIWQIGKGNAENPTVFMYHVFYSIFLATTSLILLIKILLEKNNQLKFIYIIFFITVTINLLLNIGRTGQISLIFTIIVIILIHFKTNFKYILYTLSLLIICILINYTYNSTFKHRIDFIKADIKNAVEHNNYSSSLGGRMGFWILSKEILTQNPKNFILGVGPKQHLLEANKLVDTKFHQLQYTKELNHFHSTYLSIITQSGIIGILLFIYIIYQIIQLSIKNEEIYLIKISVLSIFLFSSIVDVPFYKDVTLSLFALFIGLFLVQYKYEIRKNL